MKKDKIILTTVNAKKNLYSITSDEYSSVAPNVPAGLLASYLKSKNIEVEYIDAERDNISFDELIDKLEEAQPRLVGFICAGPNPSASTMVMAGIVDFFARLNERKPDLTTFIWGAHPTVLPDRTLKETSTDYVVRGEGYDTIVDLFHCLKANDKVDKIKGLSYMVEANGKAEIIHNQSAPVVSDLNSLPMIDWDMMNPAQYRAHNWHSFGHMSRRNPYAIIWTSFGCPYLCSYCCINNLFEKRMQRFRSIDSVITEISLLVEKYGVKHIKILDELFVTNDKKRTEEFCDRLDEKGYDLNMWCYSRVDTIDSHMLERLKKVGMNWISYGFETATPETLTDIKKGAKATVNRADEAIKMTKEAGVSICADVMFGLYDDDHAAMERTYQFLVKNNFEWGNMYPLFAYPGTVFFKGKEETASWKTYSLYGYETIPSSTKHLSSKEVLKFRDDSFLNYHSRPEYLSMIEKKFDVETKKHIEKMVKMPLKRRILEN